MKLPPKEVLVRRKFTDGREGEPLFPISAKGIVIENGKIWLRRNPRGEWELPGGRVDDQEQPQDAVKRELKEEIGYECEIETLVNSYIWYKEFWGYPAVLILSYRCRPIKKIGNPELLDEEGHKAKFQLVPIQEALELENLPNFYKAAIKEAIDAQ